MKLNKKYFFAIFTALGIQALFGVNFANAICEKELRESCKHHGDPATCNAESQTIFKKRIKDIVEDQDYFTKELIIKNINHYTSLNGSGKYHGPTFAAHAQYICEFKEALRQRESPNRADSGQQSGSDNSSSSQSSSQSSNQSSSATTSNSPVSQNKQNYQAAQIAHNQANAGRGKKRNTQAEVPECMKPNANQTHFKNACNYAVNISYCFIGEVQGSKGVDTQLLSDLNCNSQQFANTELSAGEELSGNYEALTVAAMVCKSPSQPLDMNFDGREALGRCSF
ncbi:MAG: hypothetical protein CTY37_00345 [Methylotenera sp.]|nr:MAG: hypothetical protein CTY37_00345 [Methylotenera sp.]